MKGGKRPGSGRKKLPVNEKLEMHYFRTPLWLSEKLKKMKNSSKLIRDAILEKTGWKRPG